MPPPEKSNDSSEDTRPPTQRPRPRPRVAGQRIAGSGRTSPRPRPSADAPPGAAVPASATPAKATPAKATSAKAAPSTPSARKAAKPGVAKPGVAKPGVAKSGSGAAAAKPGTAAATAKPGTAAATTKPGTAADTTKAGTAAATAKAGTSASTAKPGTRKPAAKPVTATARRTRARTHTPGRSINLPVAILSVLSLVAAAVVGYLVIERITSPQRLDPALLPAAEAAYSAMYSFDYTDPQGSADAALAVLTGDLRDRFSDDLTNEVIPAYQQVSATATVQDIEVGLQGVNDEQDEATVVGYGVFVVDSVNSGQAAAPEGSECSVNEEGADACVQTVRLSMELVDGTWLVSEVATVTAS